MGKERKCSEGNPPKRRDDSMVQKKRKLRNTTTLVNNNKTNSDGLRNLVASASGSRSPKQYHNEVTSNQKCQPSKSFKNNKTQEANRILNEKLSTANNEDIMEWEPTEKEVIDTLLEMRRDNSATSTLCCITNSVEKLTASSNVAAHIVIDTNIFLSHLPIVKTLVENEEFCSKVQILVPWMVLQELDFMKTNRQNKVNLEIFARKAATFILEQINKKNPFFRSQTLNEFKSCINLLPDENADDKILQWCLYLKKEIVCDIILLSNDILFCAKASASGIQPMQSVNFVQLLRKMLVAQTVCGSGQNVNNDAKDTSHISEDASNESPGRPMNYQQEPYDEKEVIYATRFLLQFEECILDSISQLLEYEMKQVYEDIWHQIVLIKPPWKFPDVLRCMDKHCTFDIPSCLTRLMDSLNVIITVNLVTGIAVFGYIYPRDMHEKLNHLSSMWKNMKMNGTVEQEECQMLVQSGICILHLIQRTRKQFHSTLQKAIDGLKGLLRKDTELNDAFILDLFTRVWDRFNFICGTLSDAVGVLHHGLRYEPGSTVPTLQEVTDGLQKLKPLLLKTEGAMSSVFQNSELSPSSMVEISHCILLSVGELGLQLKESARTAASLSRALTHFASNGQHRKQMEIGLEQLRVYIRVLHSVASKLH